MSHKTKVPDSLEENVQLTRLSDNVYAVELSQSYCVGTGNLSLPIYLAWDKR